MNTAIYNKGGKIQGNVAFLASFNVLYLAVSLEKLHTHTHTHSHLASNHTFFTFAYARVKRVVTPINKGLVRVPFVRFFVLFCQAAQEGNNDGFIETF